MTQGQARNSLRRRTVMETVVVKNLVSNRRSIVLVDIVDIVPLGGKFLVSSRWQERHVNSKPQTISLRYRRINVLKY
jgi:hypothetical protein